MVFIGMIAKELMNVVVPVRNGRNAISRTLHSILNQRLPAPWRLDITVIDDGSTDDLRVFLLQHFGGRIHFFALDEPSGRAIARNKGAHATEEGELIAFLDADCRYSTSTALSCHVSTILSGADVSCGPITTPGTGFWSRYQRSVSETRLERFRSGERSAMTSANFVVKRHCFESINGFDEAYAQYGFEDRDFFLRVLEIGANISISANAVAIHGACLSLRELCKKMRDAAMFNSKLFLHRHPVAYSRMSYAQVDARLHGPLFRAIARVAAPAWPTLTKIATPLLNSGALPFFVGRFLVRFVTALAYLEGSLVANEA